MWSMQSPQVSPRRSLRIPMSPQTPVTPQKPVWITRCEQACARSRFPTSFALLPAPDKNEDRLVVDWRSGETLWAVFDGHRSREVSGFAAMTVPQLVWSSQLWPAHPGEALSTALRDCHELARREGSKGGSTAVVVATVGEAIYCASAGDSHVVAGLSNGGHMRLSVHHNTSSPEEVARIRAAGGKLEWGRLGGFMPVTRGIGNFDLEAEGFTSMPDVRALPRHDVDFVVIASDGLWDVISDEQCCALIRQWGPEASAEQLACTAQHLWEQKMASADDIAIVIVHFPVHSMSSVLEPSTLRMAQPLFTAAGAASLGA